MATKTKEQTEPITIEAVVPKVVPTDKILRIRDLQVRELALKNSLYELQAQAKDVSTQYQVVKRELDTAFTEAASLFPEEKLDPLTLKFSQSQ